MRPTLRVIAVLIAVAGTIDPAFQSVDASSRPVVAVRAAAEIDAAERALRSALSSPVITRDVTNGRLPCDSDDDCVVIADGSIDLDWDQRLRPVSLIKMPIAGQPNVRMRSVSVSRGHRAAAGTARVHLEGRGVTGKRTAVRVIDRQAVLGAVTHEWSTGGTAVVDVPWWPLDTGARALQIEAAPIDGEITAIDNRIDVGVAIAASKIPVLIFDARPSWHSTFVRRALEDDERFAVGYRSRLAPAVSAGTAGGRLDAATLDRVPLVIVGGPDALTAADVSLIERFVKVRGGTLVVLPERRPSGESARLFHGTWTEHLNPTPESIGPLRATELLRVADVSPASTVLAASGTVPVIVSSPTGAGRIVVSGAMDAWRYRSSNRGALALSEVEGFDRFWRSLAAEAAAAGEGLTITFANDVVEYGARTTFTLRDRRMDPSITSEASVVQRCGDALAQPVRVWPRGAIGEFAGEVSALANGTCTIEAGIGDRQVSASLAVVDHASRSVDDTLAKLERRVRASGGVVTNAGDEAAIARTLGDDPPTVSRVVTAHPMRRAWWMLPFAACLSIEWWLRRRAGLR
ncbi:MAG: hypothetical protein K2Y23_11760 [Cyanobacteria bacterium]|nr:hypothetical protein [Cyanobacteriota bacterium]